MTATFVYDTLLADNSECADSLTSVSLRGAYHRRALSVYAEVINLLDTGGKDINYEYEAFVAGFDDVIEPASLAPTILIVQR